MVDPNEVISLYFAVSKECNLKCSYCYLKDTNRNQETNDARILDSIHAFISKCTKDGIRLMHVGLHGAEPTMMEPQNLMRAARMFHEVAEGGITVQTNGTRISDEYLAAMIEEDPTSPCWLNFSISLDGHKEAHNKYRNNSYDKVIAGIHRTVALGFRTHILAVVTDDTIQNLELFNKEMTLLKKLGVNLAFQIVEINSSMTLDSRMKFSKWMRDSGNTSGFQPLKPDICINMGNECKFYEFDVDGNVYSCNKIFDDSGSFANWHTDSMPTIIDKRTDVYANYEVAAECKLCEHYELCHGGCPLTRKEGLPEDCVIRKDIYLAGYRPTSVSMTLAGSTGSASGDGLGGADVAGDGSLGGAMAAAEAAAAAFGDSMFGGASSDGGSSFGGLVGTTGMNPNGTVSTSNFGGLTNSTSVSPGTGTGFFGSGIESMDAHEAFAASVSSNNMTTGSGTGLGGWGGRSNTISESPSTGFFGSLFGLNSYSVNGQEVGMVAEMGLDIGVALGMSATVEGANALGALSTAMTLGLLGAPSFAVGLATSMALNDTALATGLIGQSTHTTISLSLSVVSFSVVAFAGMQAVAALTSVPGLSLTARTLGVASVSLGMGIASQALSDAMDEAGVTTSALSASAVASFARSGDGMRAEVKINSMVIQSTGTLEGSGVTIALLQLFAIWDKLNSIPAMTPDSIQTDPFEFMAGGGTYNAQFAGGPMYLCNELRSSTGVANQNLSVSNLGEQLLTGEDSIYVNLEPINTALQKSAEDPMAVVVQGKIRKYDEAIGTRNNAVATTNKLVEVANGLRTTAQGYTDEYAGYVATYNKLVNERAALVSEASNLDVVRRGEDIRTITIDLGGLMDNVYMSGSYYDSKAGRYKAEFTYDYVDRYGLAGNDFYQDRPLGLHKYMGFEVEADSYVHSDRLREISTGLTYMPSSAGTSATWYINEDRGHNIIVPVPYGGSGISAYRNAIEAPKMQARLDTIKKKVATIDAYDYAGLKKKMDTATTNYNAMIPRIDRAQVEVDVYKGKVATAEAEMDKLAKWLERYA